MLTAPLAPAHHSPCPTPVCIIDDDESVRRAFERLLVSAGFPARTFRDSAAFLHSDAVATGICVISDVKMHGMTGLELQRRLLANGVRVSMIFVTAHDTPEARKEAREAGAIAYFRKPVDDQALIDAILWGLRQGEGP